MNFPNLSYLQLNSFVIIYRHLLRGHASSFDQEFFWKAVTLYFGIPPPSQYTHTHLVNTFFIKANSRTSFCKLLFKSMARFFLRALPQKISFHHLISMAEDIIRIIISESLNISFWKMNCLEIREIIGIATCQQLKASSFSMERFTGILEQRELMKFRRNTLTRTIEWTLQLY